VPKAFRKDKNIVKEILRDHRKTVGMTDMNAKFRYVQLVRGLKTYGITFFECEQREKGKKKVNIKNIKK
jgi:talin